MEADWQALPGFGVYGEFAIDEFTTAYEKERDGGGGPGIFGWLCGADFSMAAGNGFLSGYGEYAHTDPFLYILSGNDATYYDDASYYNIRRYWSYITDSWESIVRPLGFSLGPDARSYTLHLQYEVPGRWMTALECSFAEKGEIDWRDKPDIADVEAALKASFPTGVVERSLLLHLSGEYCLSSSWAVQGDCYNRYRWNIDHQRGEEGFDLEFALGLRYEP
jgi:hypothetical protein